MGLVVLNRVLAGVSEFLFDDWIGMIVITRLTMSAAVSEQRKADEQTHRLTSALAHAGRVNRARLLGRH